MDNKVNLTKNDIVCKTQDYLLQNELKKYNEKKISILINVKCKLNEQAEITISDNTNHVTIKGSCVQSHLNVKT